MSHLSLTKSPELADELAGLPLSIVFAEGDAIARVRERGEGAILLAPPFHVSDDDTYLVLPEDIGLEIVDMFKDGDLDLLAEAMRDGLCAIGVVERAGKGKVELHVERCAAPAELLARMPFAEKIGFGRGVDPVPLLNALDHAQLTVASTFVDARGVSSMLTQEEWAGASWRVPKDRKELAGVDPTYAWTKRQKDGHVGIEAALFVEYEELVLVLRPALLLALDRSFVGMAPASP